jgi:hypothetical protein
MAVHRLTIARLLRVTAALRVNGRKGMARAESGARMMFSRRGIVAKIKVEGQSRPAGGAPPDARFRENRPCHFAWRLAQRPSDA